MILRAIIIIWVYSRSPHGERGLKSGRGCVHPVLDGSLPARGAWVEISSICGAACQALGSLPARGAWVEIAWLGEAPEAAFRRSPHGERGLKSTGAWTGCIKDTRRSPHGERGLK